MSELYDGLEMDAAGGVRVRVMTPSKAMGRDGYYILRSQTCEDVYAGARLFGFADREPSRTDDKDWFYVVQAHSAGPEHGIPAADVASMGTLPTDNAARKALPLWDFMFHYFPDAWLAVVGVAVEGNKQHNPGEPLHWAREKSTDQLNTAFRHQFDYGTGTKKDTDGCYHLAKAIWRLSAQLQLDIERERADAKETVK